jgi:hypothetical protein
MKLQQWGWGVLAGILLCTGCNKASVDDTAETTTEKQAEEQADFSTPVTYTDEAFEKLQVQAQETFSKNDGKNYIKYSNGAFLDQKMYYFNEVSFDPHADDFSKEGFQIYWYDTDTGEEGVLGGSDHIFPYDTYGTAICSWNDTLYMFQNVEDCWWLAALEPESGETTPVCRLDQQNRFRSVDQSLVTEDDVGIDIPESSLTFLDSVEMLNLAKLHRGAVYGVLDCGTVLTRWDIESSQAEILYQTDDIWEIDSASCQFVGDDIYFEISPVGDSSTIRLMRTSLADGSTELVLKLSAASSSASQTVILSSQQILYYKAGSGVMEYNPQIKEERCFCENDQIKNLQGSCSVTYDGMFVYLVCRQDAASAQDASDAGVYVMDLTGQPVRYLSFANVNDASEEGSVYTLRSCANSDVLYGECISDDVAVQLMVLDKKKLFVDGIEEWKFLAGK